MNNEKIGIGNLRDGDILVYRGKSRIAWLIRLFDDAEVNHAAVYLGGQRVGEALGGGLTERGVAESIEDVHWVKARRLKDRPDDMSPVVLRARWYLDRGERYAYEQIILLAFLSMIRHLKVTPILGKLIRAILERASSLILRLINGEKQPMICSEFVARCYEEAQEGLDDPYSLRIRWLSMPGLTPAATRLVVSGNEPHPQSLLSRLAVEPRTSWLPGPTVLSGASLDGMREPQESEIEELVRQYAEEIKQADSAGAILEMDDVGKAAGTFVLAVRAATSGGLSPSALTPLDHFSRVAADFVTPRQLHTADSLYTVGELE